ncbi:MAG: M18 family aminopeptidase, partial [Spirochaetota bacterium]
KERAASWRRGYLVLPTEIYGGPIQSTWADREIGVAGRLATADGSVHLFELADRGVVPNVAIHLNRKVNEGFAFNAQDHLAALVASDAGRSDGPATDWLFERCARAVTGLEIDPGSVVELEALLFDPGAGSFLGHDGSIYLSPRIDNLAGVFTNLEAFVEGGGGPRILALYNHEEVGSQTGEGAQSAMLEKLLARLVRASGGDDEDLAVALERSLVVSNDAAHALHPSYGEKYDPDYAPVLGGGPVLKVNGKYRYATTASTGARFARACSDAGVPMQRLANRSDIPSGSTVGPITWARTGIATVDVGIPILAMHSIREAGGTADLQSMISTLVAMLA